VSGGLQGLQRVEQSVRVCTVIGLSFFQKVTRQNIVFRNVTLKAGAEERPQVAKRNKNDSSAIFLSFPPGSLWGEE
jgi:hypothetical protein